MFETDLSRIKELAQRKERENWKFRSHLKGCDLSPKELDALVRRLNAQVSSKIDCSACRNCCRELGPALEAEDTARLAEAEHMTPDEFVRKYQFRSGTEGKLVTEQRPCPFLSGNACRHHDIRPRGCVEFPYLDKPEFTTRLITVVSNVSLCPIVYNVYELLKDEVTTLELLRQAERENDID